MPAASRTASGAPRPADRRPRRQSHHKTRLTPRQALERLGLLLVEVDEPGMDEPEQYSAREQMREPGDEAGVLVVLTRPDGYCCTCGDCRDYHQCDCEEYGRHGWDCRHLRALVRLEVFRPVHRWSATAPGGKGGGA